MDIQVGKLRNLLDLFKPVVPKKPTLPVLKFVYIGDGRAIATDLSVMVIASLPEMKNDKPVLLPFTSVLEMLKYVPGTDMLQITTEGKKVKLAYTGGSASYATEDSLEFPIPSSDVEVKAEGMLDGDTMVPAMLAALPYVSTEENRPALTGVALTLGSPIEVAAADSFRLSHQVLGFSFPKEEKVIIPADAVKVLGHVFAKTAREPSSSDTLIEAITAKRRLYFSIIDGKLKVDFGQDYSVVIKLIESTFPEILGIIPKGEPIMQSQVFAPQFEAALRRVKDVAKSGSGMVRLDFATDGALTLSAQGADNDISGTLNTLSTKGEPHSVGIDIKYLLEYFSKKEGIVIISRHDNSGPVSLQYQKTPKVLIMPMKLGEVQKSPETEEAKSTTETTKDETEEGDSETTEEDTDTEGEGQETEETQEVVTP